VTEIIYIDGPDLDFTEICLLSGNKLKFILKKNIKTYSDLLFIHLRIDRLCFQSKR